MPTAPSGVPVRDVDGGAQFVWTATQQPVQATRLAACGNESARLVESHDPPGESYIGLADYRFVVLSDELGKVRGLEQREYSSLGARGESRRYAAVRDLSGEHKIGFLDGCALELARAVRTSELRSGC